VATLAPSQAASELLRRRELRSNLVEWAKFYGQDRGWIIAKHHLLLLQTLQAVTDGTLIHPITGKPCSNVMVLMPPGSAKSQNTSVIFPPWFLQRRPGTRILACSCSADLIESFSRECRNSVDTNFKQLGYSLAQDSRAVAEWSTTNGGTYKCAGVGAAISGRRADAGVIDDYIGSQEDADSKLIRDKQWQWYLNDFWTRLKPNSIQIIVANRRHEDDLVGRILEKEQNDWVVIRLPFFAEDNDPLGRVVGEPLWKEWFTPEMARKIAQLPARTQAGLYQQRPAPEEGDYFKSEWLLTYDRDEYEQIFKSPDLRVYGAGDWAVSESKDANRSCFGGAVETNNGTIYILPDLFWKVSGPSETVKAFVDFLQRRKPLVTWSEKGHISKAWGPFLKEQMQERQVYAHIEEVTPARAKDVRARSIQGRMSMGKVKFPAFASWWPSAMHELLTFPGGKTDDFVDFIAHIGMGLASITRGGKVSSSEVEDLNTPFKPTLGWLKKQDKEAKAKLQLRYLGK